MSWYRWNRLSNIFLYIYLTIYRFTRFNWTKVREINLILCNFLWFSNWNWYFIKKFTQIIILLFNFLIGLLFIDLYRLFFLYVSLAVLRFLGFNNMTVEHIEIYLLFFIKFLRFFLKTWDFIEEITQIITLLLMSFFLNFFHFYWLTITINRFVYWVE